MKSHNQSKPTLKRKYPQEPWFKAVTIIGLMSVLKNIADFTYTLVQIYNAIK